MLKTSLPWTENITPIKRGTGNVKQFKIGAVNFSQPDFLKNGPAISPASDRALSHMRIYEKG
jgi:hypothetical protein